MGNDILKDMIDGIGDFIDLVFDEGYIWVVPLALAVFMYLVFFR